MKDYLNREVVITFEMGYTYSSKKGIVTKTAPDFITLDNKVLIATKKIVKVIVKEEKESKI